MATMSLTLPLHRHIPASFPLCNLASYRKKFLNFRTSSSNFGGSASMFPSIFENQFRGRRFRSFSTVISCSLMKLSDAVPIPVPSDDEASSVSLPSNSGVYAIYDGKGELQFIGLSRNIEASVSTHQKKVPELCISVKVGTVLEPDRAALTNAWKSWMEEHISSTGKVPPGNESGNTTWLRQQQRKSDLRLTPGRHVQLTVPLEELIDRMVKENEVVAFIKGSRSAPQCGFSQRVVGILEAFGVDFESVDVLDEVHNSGLRETLKKYSNWPTFPQVFVKGELLGGCDIITSMAENGELAKLLQK